MFKLEIKTAGAAFEEAQTPECEIARILSQAVRQLYDGNRSGVCFDANGNRVGSWSIDDED